jgi:hypothetical protein
MSTIKVPVTLTLDIDPQMWDLAFGTGTDEAAVRDDVRAYLVNYFTGADLLDLAVQQTIAFKKPRN